MSVKVRWGKDEPVPLSQKIWGHGYTKPRISKRPNDTDYKPLLEGKQMICTKLYKHVTGALRA